MKKRSWYIGAGLLVVVIVLAGSQVWLQRAAEAQSRGAVQAPAFDVDPFWPKPLPNHWVLGSVVGVSVDEDDHVWIIHRPPSLGDNERGLERNPPFAECCAAAPPVLEFDGEGRLVGHWGGPGSG